MRVLSCIFLLLLLGWHPVAVASEPEFPGEHELSGVSASACYHLPFVCDGESTKRAYETISMQAVSSGGTLTVTIKNTEKRDVVLFSSGVHIRLCRTPFYVMQGKKIVALSFPKKLVLASGEEWRGSCSLNDISSHFVHVGFVSLLVVGERVYDGLPERKLPIQRGADGN